MPAKLLDGASDVVSTYRQVVDHGGEDLVAIDAGPDHRQRRRPIVFDGTDIETDAGDDHAGGPAHELRQNSGEFPRLLAVLHEQVVGPLESDLNRSEPRDGGTNRRSYRHHHPRRSVGFDRETKAHQEVPAGSGVPHTIEAAPPGRLQIRNEHTRLAIARSRLIR